VIDDDAVAGLLEAVSAHEAEVITPAVGAISDPAWSRISPYRHRVLVCRGPRCSAPG
jgi:hypothetical protein